MSNKFSVVIPVYNVEKYIAKCVESIVCQLKEADEVILVDDGSKDNSGKVCDELSEKYKNVKVLHQTNSGCSVARNNGIDMATGDYIIFADSDDRWESSLIEKVEKVLENHSETDLVIFGASVRDINENILSVESIPSEKSGSTKELLLNIDPSERGCALNYIWNKAYKTSVIKENNIKYDTDIDLGEDFLFNCKFFKAIENVQVLPEQLYIYYKYSSSQLTSKFRNDELERRDRIYDKHIDLYKYYGIYDEYKENLLIEEGLLTLNSLMMCSYTRCNLTLRQINSYIKSFVDSSHYEAAKVYIDSLNNIKPNMKLFLKKRVNTLSLYCWSLRFYRRLKGNK